MCSFWVSIKPALELVHRIGHTFITQDVKFTKDEFEETIKRSSHLRMLSLRSFKLELNGDFDFSIDEHYSIKFFEIAYNFKIIFIYF